MITRACAIVFSLAAAACTRPSRAAPDPSPSDAAATSVRSAPALSASGGNAEAPPEAIACQAASDCERVSLRAPSEQSGGPCCAVCGGYAAVNRAYQARQPVCDPLARGACPVGCAEGRPPPVACEAGRCVLTYPPVSATCANDSDCVAVPALLPGAPPGGCRLACGQYVAGNRKWDAWAASLWQNTSVVGACPETCVDRPLASAACVAGRCALRAPSTIRTTRVDLRTPTVKGPLSAAAVAGVVAASRGQLEACHERPRPIAPIGYVGFQMTFVVGSDGRVTDANAGALADHLPDIASCMTRVLRSLQFPQLSGGGTARVDYPVGAAFETR